jgi:hypothetical protein
MATVLPRGLNASRMVIPVGYLACGKNAYRRVQNFVAGDDH